MNSTELTQLHDTFIGHSRTSRQHFAAAKLGRLMQFVRYDLSHWNHWNRPTRVRNCSSVQFSLKVFPCVCVFTYRRDNTDADTAVDVILS